LWFSVNQKALVKALCVVSSSRAAVLCEATIANKFSGGMSLKRLQSVVSASEVMPLTAGGSVHVEVLQWALDQPLDQPLDLGPVGSVNDLPPNSTGAGFAGLAARGSVPAWTGRSR
jgi:hypothetical protein